MKKVIAEKKEGIIQITTYDERWYARQEKDKKTGLPIYKYVPSVTWIASYYPKGISFYKWLAQKGWDEAEAIKQAAGDKGSKVHYAISSLLNGGTVKMEDKFLNPTTEQEEELTLEEYECLMSFADWFNKTKPEILANEMVAINERVGYAGTLDCICKIKDKTYILDFKTSQYIWPEHEIQISAYLHCKADKIVAEKPIKVDRLAILQLGYRKNKANWKFTEIEDKFELFLHAKAIWENECKGIEPKQKDYPLELTLEKGEDNART